MKKKNEIKTLFDDVIKATNNKTYFLHWYSINDKQFIEITQTSKHSDTCELLEAYDFKEL